MARKTKIEDIPFSVFKVSILDLLKQYGFIKEFVVVEQPGSVKKTLHVVLKKVVNPIDDIPHVKFFSKPSRPWYVSYKDLKLVAWGKGIGIISTNQGLMATHVAHTKKIGWELIAEIY